MTTKKDVPVEPPKDAPAAGVKCPYCNDTGFYRPADGSADSRFDDPDFYELCPYCKASTPDEKPEITPPDAPYDPQPKASGYELQIFGIIGIVLLLVGAVIGVIKSITLTQRGAIPSIFHNHYAVGWVLLALALLLLSGATVWVVHLLKKRR